MGALLGPMIPHFVRTRSNPISILEHIDGRPSVMVFSPAQYVTARVEVMENAGNGNTSLKPSM